MPPKVKITKNDIIKTALELLRKDGPDAINARSIAAAIGCSTQPIFSNFATMEELQIAIISAVYELYSDFLRTEAESGNYPQYKAFGMAYIRFAKEERQLFRLLFMRDRSGEDTSIMSPDFDDSIEIIMKNNSISKEKAILLHLEMWACVHGIATMIATSFCTFEWTVIENILSDVYKGVIQRHIGEEN
jgi:AcrR family transcriptional regulator